MLYKNPRKLLSEAATAELLDPDVSEEVKDVVNDLEEDLTNNVEEVEPELKTTNGGIPVTTESASLLESVRYRGRYYLPIETVMAIKEAEGEEAAAEDAPEGEAPSADECEAHEPDAGDVIEDIAQANNVDPDQVTVVISAESANFYVETAILEAKAGKKKGKGKKKLKKLAKTVEELKDAKVKIAKA